MRQNKLALWVSCICVASAANAAGRHLPPINVAPIGPPPTIETIVTAPLPDEKIGDWTVSYFKNGTVIASVANSADARFGSICTSSGCDAFFNPTTTCDDGSKYPALVNAPSSAFPVIMKCIKSGDLYVYSFPLEGGVSEAMSVGGVIGFAIPMASGEFKVVRFSLTGAARATARAQQQAGKSGASMKADKSDNYAL